MYILHNGDEVTLDQITSAFLAGNAVLVHGHAENRTVTGLMLDGKHYDTRGECYTVWDEVWTQSPDTLQECLCASFVPV